MVAGLPFGETDVDSQQIDELVDRSRAIRALETGGVDRPEERLDAFIEQVPALLEWLAENGREYPWRYTTDPWRIYVTEVLLQRTRADAVAGIYETFFARYPDAETLYRADNDEIFQVIEQLGFGNQRTRTLSGIAELVYQEHNGNVPASIDELSGPFRAGPYSARACLLFAFGKPVALVDANIARVVTRVFDYEMPDQPHKSDEVYALMEALVPANSEVARAFNLALVDLGGLVCTPERPGCNLCPISGGCLFLA